MEVVWTVSELQIDGAEREMDAPNVYSALESWTKGKKELKVQGCETRARAALGERRRLLCSSPGGPAALNGEDTQIFSVFYLTVAERDESDIIYCHLLDRQEWQPLTAVPYISHRLSSPKTRARKGFTKTMQPI